MAKTIASKKAALHTSLCGLTTPRLALLTACPAETLHDPSTWVEIAQYGTTSRPTLSGGLIPTTGSATTNTGDSPDTIQIQFPTSDVTLAAVTGAGFTVVALAVVDGTAAFTTGTVGRVVDIADKAYSTSDIPLFATSAWTAKE